jgi:anti-anti-sigma factor
MELRVVTSLVGGMPVLALDGVADLSTAPVLHRALAGITAPPNARTVAVDLDGVAVLDDVAVGMLLGAAARIREQGAELVLVCTSPRVVARLDALRVDRIVPIRHSIAAADGSAAR